MSESESPKRGMKQISADEFDLSAAIGGVRGVIESVAPVIVFLAIYLSTHELWWAAGLALVVAAGLLVARLIARTAVNQALGGFLGVSLCVLWAGYSGSAEGYFAPGLVVNAVYGSIVLLSALFRYPIIGFIDGLARGEKNWRTSPKMGRYYLLTVMWAALFALRLAVQWPLYASGNVAALGTARLVMGIPLFATAIFISWLVLRDRNPQDEGQADPATPEDRQHRPQ